MYTTRPVLERPTDHELEFCWFGCKTRTRDRRKMDDTDSDMRESRGGSESRDAQMPNIPSFVADWLNIVTRLGLCRGILAFLVNMSYSSGLVLSGIR